MNETYTCAHCGRESKDEGRDRCECGTWYCSLRCVIKSLDKIGIYQRSWDEVDKCGHCAMDKLKSRDLKFPGRFEIKRHLAPCLWIYLIDNVGPKVQKKKVCEGQISLF